MKDYEITPLGPSKGYQVTLKLSHGGELDLGVRATFKEALFALQQAKTSLNGKDQ